MKGILSAVIEVAKTSALDGSINRADVRNNKKKVALGLAKSVAWTLVQRHPLYIAFRLAMWGVISVAVIVFLLVLWFTFS